jgi:FixJ family two-component response regulator
MEKLTEMQLAVVGALVEALGVQAAADALGVHRLTVKAWRVGVGQMSEAESARLVQVAGGALGPEAVDLLEV